MHRTFVLLAFICPATALAQEAKVETRSIVLSAAAAPVPALKYSLLPEMGDLKPGNAALIYQRAHSPEWWNALARDDSFAKTEWFAGPLESFPKAEADKILRHRGIYKEIDFAARRAGCDWDMIERMRADGISMLLPDVQSFRQFGVLAGIRTRRALTEKKYAEASHSLQTGFALCQHVAEGPTLINFLVAVAIGSSTTGQVEDWLQIPGSPNLY